MPKLLLATNNRGKILELQALLGDLGIELVTPAQLGLSFDVPEDGQTYAENAVRKAEAFAAVSGLAVLADDSGLEVDALGGRPGVHSARYVPGPHASDADRRARLLEELRVQAPPWKARFRCFVAFASQLHTTQIAQGECPGEIIPDERGRNGFGYDPIFLIPALGRTMAELSMEEKNHLSHRARAVLAIKPNLALWLTNSL